MRVQVLLNPHTVKRVSPDFPMPSELSKHVQVVPVDHREKDADDRFILRAGTK